MEVSVDPGRFVCNFLYFSSLRQAVAHSGWQVLFVHVPPFTAVKEELHQQFALDLLKRIAGLPAPQDSLDSALRVGAVRSA